MPRKRPLFSASPQRVLSPSRRRFLQGAAATVAGIGLANCRQNITGGAGNTTGSSTGGGTDKLHIYSWADYVDDEAMALFTEETGIEVVRDIFDSNEQMLAKLQAGGGDAYSLIYPSDYMVTEMVDLGLLTELDKSRIEGLENLLPQWQDPIYDPGNTHSIAHTWGTTGLLFNQELVTGNPEDWSYLWENQEAMSRRITLLDDVRETLGATLKSLGYSYNATDPQELKAAFDRLVELKPHLASFKSYGFEGELLGGDLTMVMSYSVDAIAATLEDERMIYVVPASGSSIWTDTMVIPKSAPAVDAAYQWMNFVLRPEISKGLVERLYFATPNSATYDLLPDDLKTNKNLFPDETVIAKCEGIAPLAPDVAEIYDQYWTQITSA